MNLATKPPSKEPLCQNQLMVAGQSTANCASNRSAPKCLMFEHFGLARNDRGLLSDGRFISSDMETMVFLVADRSLNHPADWLRNGCLRPIWATFSSAERLDLELVP